MRFRLTRLALASAFLFFFSFPPFFTGIFAFVALIPLFLIIEHQTWKTAFRLSYLCGLATLGVLLYWLNMNSGATQLQATSMYLGTIAYLSFWWGLYGALQAGINARWGRGGFLAAPFLWTVVDYAQSLGELGFTWHSLATTQTYYRPVIQFIEFTGMYGLTFWLTSINVILFLLWKSGDHVPARRAWGIGLTALLTLPFVYGAFRISTFNNDGTTVTVAVIQPNIEPNQKWLERDFAFNEILRLSEQLPSDSIDLVLWPETAIPNRIPADHGKYEAILDLLKRKRSSLLTGIPHREKTLREGRPAFVYFNSVYLLYAGLDTIQMYHKNHLVPFGEYVPSFLRPLKDMAMSIGVPDYTAGEVPTIFHVPISRYGGVSDTIGVGAAVCLESVFPQLVRRQVVDGSRLTAIVTNDAWYDGTTGPAQHARIAVLRAVENRIPVIRSANSGVSNIVDASGAVLQETANGVQGVLISSVALPDRTSLYARHGEWFPYLCIVAVFLFIVAGAIFKFEKT